MEVIMLIGEPNKGKTAVLHFVHEILVASGAKTTCVKREGAKNQRDFSDVLIYLEKRIKILTMGDCEKPIREALSTTGCDFLICACNNDHKKFFKQAKHLVEKTVADDFSCRLAANWYDANIIIEQLKRSIK